MAHIIAALLSIAVLSNAELLPRLITSASAANITSVITSGPGCPVQSVQYHIGPESQAVTVTFSVFIAEASAITSRYAPETYCDISLALDFPIGCSSVSLNVDNRGYAQIDEGALGTWTSLYSISSGALTGNRPPTARLTDGRNTERHSLSAVVAIQEASQQHVVFTSRKNLTVALTDLSLSGFIAVDSIDISISKQGICS
jgi:hypothetical protein